MRIGLIYLHGQQVPFRLPERVAAHGRFLERCLAAPIAPGEVPDDCDDGCGEGRIEDQDCHDLTVAGQRQPTAHAAPGPGPGSGDVRLQRDGHTVRHRRARTARSMNAAVGPYRRRVRLSLQTPVIDRPLSNGTCSPVAIIMSAANPAEATSSPVGVCALTADATLPTSIRRDRGGRQSRREM